MKAMKAMKAMQVSGGYAGISWDGFKKVYDLILAMGVVGYVLTFLVVSTLFFEGQERISPGVVMIRATGSCALILLHLVLMIGPLARFFPRALGAAVHNRRHLFVATFLVVSVHAVLVLDVYHGDGAVAPLVSLLLSNPNYTDPARFPFELFGVGAYLILLVLAATSHDFWEELFGEGLWTLMHMGIHFAYALTLAYVLFGYVLASGSFVGLYVLGGAAAVVVSLHLWAGLAGALAGGGAGRGGRGSRRGVGRGRASVGRAGAGRVGVGRAGAGVGAGRGRKSSVRASKRAVVARGRAGVGRAGAGRKSSVRASGGSVARGRAGAGRGRKK